MIQSSIILLFTGLILLLPLVFWMYIFVSFFHHGVSRKQFLFGIGAGIISSFPLVYRDVYFFGDVLEDIFFYLSVLSSSIFGEQLFLSLSLFFLVVWGGVFLVSYIFQSDRVYFLKVQGVSLIAFASLLILGVGDMIFLDNFLSKRAGEISVGFGDITFVSLGGIVGYYIVISLLEEGSKYISSLTLSGREKYFKIFQKYICMSASIALGFAFFENILYTLSYFSQEGVSYNLMQLVFFRSLFSVIIHLVASMLFAMAFWYVLHISSTFYKSVISFLFLAFIAIGSHVFFDISLTFGYIGLIFFYIIAIYLLLSYLTIRIE